MTHYEKLTLVTIKTFGLLALLYGATGVLVSGISILLHEMDTPFNPATLQITQLFYFATPLVFGVFILKTANTLVKTVCDDLEEEEIV